MGRIQHPLGQIPPTYSVPCSQASLTEGIKFKAKGWSRIWFSYEGQTPKEQWFKGDRNVFLFHRRIWKQTVRDAIYYPIASETQSPLGLMISHL